ncbi:MAG: hypothetical protein KME15_25955 [Drouetiella hepatica Uher 2000/2452]|uniref:Uncharacterized protein n=1 Tax=Drouetiella hepatica Uher 2000/2452 TaxID=904376 RepID=A0A951QGB6_9CYAN|nr:hypothetical protein [Drouetiella hepatica Uher 2000/2452]
MNQNERDREQLESACVAISQILRDLLEEGKIDALEFLSAVGHLPVKLSELNPHKWTF